MALSGLRSTRPAPSLSPGAQPPNCGAPLAEPSLGDCADERACFKAAAAACSANAACGSFGLSPVWGGGQRAKLFKNVGTGLVANRDWLVFAKTVATSGATAHAPMRPHFGAAKTSLDEPCPDC